MRFSWMAMWLIGFYAMSLAVGSLADVVMIQALGNYGKTEVTCVAEDDGAALVLNLPNLISITPTRTSTGTITIDTSTKEYNEDWQNTNSFEHPMGPVFDYRWEGLQRYPVGKEDGRSYGYSNVYTRGPESGTILFSARGLGDIDMLLCESTKPSDGSCSIITITVWPNKTSIIPSDPNKVSGVTELSKDYVEGEVYPELNRRLINEYEWRTFLFEWDEKKMKLQVYGGDWVSEMPRSGHSKHKNNILVGSYFHGIVRGHFYGYSRTTTQGAKLFTKSFYQPGKNICIELLVSLCSECELDVSAVTYDDRNEWIVGKISGHKKLAFGKLITWRFEKLNVTLRNFKSASIKLKISTRKNNSAIEGLWAYDHMRTCQPDAISKSSVSISGIWNSNKYVHQTVVAGCQKLSHTENTVVRKKSKDNHNISSDLLESLRKKLDLYSNYETSDWYSGKTFCDQNGCSCAPGFNGSDCEEACADGSYGYNCREQCGQCGFGTCSKTTGFCRRYCAVHYLPPYCQTKLQPPGVTDTDQTTATLRLPYPTDLDLDKKLDLRVELKTSNENWRVLRTKTSDPPMLEIRICGLVSGTNYTARAVMLAQTENGDQVDVLSPEIHFLTPHRDHATMPDPAPCLIGACNIDDQHPGTPSRLPCTQHQAPNNLLHLKVIIREKGLVTLKWDHPPYPCTQISSFQVHVTRNKTKLQNYPSQQFTISEKYVPQDYQQPYTIDLNLPTSTCYELSVEAMNTYGSNEEALRLEASFQVPSSIGFSNGEVPEVSYHGTSINLIVPAVINATKNSRLLVIVKGSLPCSKDAELPKSLRKHVNMSESEPGCIAKNLPIEGSSSKNLTIGEDSTDIASDRCPLDPAKTHEIVVVLLISQDDMFAIVASLPKKPTSIRVEGPEKSVVWIIIFLILIICFILLFIWRRKLWSRMKRKHGQNLVACSEALTGFVKSVTTCTFRKAPPMPDSAEAEPCEIVSTSNVVAWSRHSHSVNIDDFENYVKDSISSGLLKSQFEMFSRGLIKPSVYGSLPANKSKNRYPNIIPYDDTRVVLEKIPNNRHSDYINANHVQSIDSKLRYIAAQGPKPQTVIDFWRMIWQEKALTICMLTNVLEGQKVKCEQYWPEFGESKTYDDIVVVTVKNDTFADYTFRMFQVSCKDECRKIEHLHFTGWPDHSVPSYSNSVIKYLKKLQALYTGKAPIIVHCSAGIGRTGTIILCDICSRQAIAKGTVDVLAEFKKLRDCRMNLVDNEIQYLFVHVVLTEFLVSHPTELVCNNDLPRAVKEMKKKLPQHMERLRNIAWQDQALQKFKSSPRPPIPEQLAKNRFPELVPDSCCDLVYLKRYPTHDNHSDYINAIFVNGARVKRQYLASQLPLPSTLSDFWRLIAEQRIELVIVLQSPDPHDPTCCDIIPGAEKPLNPVPFISVELKVSSGPEKLPRAVELLLTDTSEREPRTQQIRVLTCIEWDLGRGGKPPPPSELVELWTASEKIYRGERPTLVLCHDGVTGCGLYLSLSFILERMAVERECDVIFGVRAIRRSRADFVPSKEQFEYLYDAAATYFESFETYANFT